jgi:hypothetical protein
MSVDPTRGVVESGIAEDGEPPLERLRSLLLEEGGLMSSLVLDGADDGSPDVLSWSAKRSTDPSPSRRAAAPATGLVDPGIESPAQVVASGPRAEGNRQEYELLVETIYEGYLLHYHDPRVVRAPEADLGLLAGERLYALGLARLVRLGDVEGVAELADVITLCALAHGGGQPELAAGIWMAGARAVGFGASPEHEHAKALVRAGSPDALAALRALADIES